MHHGLLRLLECDDFNRSEASNMKKYLVGLAIMAIGAVTATVAVADGMPRRGSIKDGPVAGPTCGTSAYNWNGAFAGVQLGTASGRTTIDTDDVNFKGAQREETGFTIGGVIGYNWQKCNTVFGIEAELNWTDLDKSYRINELTWGLPFASVRTSMDWYGALKMRTGLAFDNLLLYLTGGFAFANIEHSGTGEGMITGSSFSSSGTRWGWVVGAGTEYALTNRITLRSEATYTRFNDKEYNFTGQITPPGGAPAPFSMGLIGMDEIWMIRTGLNFKF